MPRCSSAGTLPIGLMARYSGDFMPLPYSCTTVRYSTPSSSSIQRTMRPRDMGLVWKTGSLLVMADSSVAGEGPKPPLIPRRSGYSRDRMGRDGGFPRRADRGYGCSCIGAGSAGVLDSGGDAVDGGEQGALQGLVLAAGLAPAAQQLHLQQADRVDVGIAQAD